MRNELEISAIYLLGNKPQIVWGNTYLNFSLGFHYTEHKVPNEFMGDFAKIAKMMLEKTGPKVTIYGIKNSSPSMTASACSFTL